MNGGLRVKKDLSREAKIFLLKKNGRTIAFIGRSMYPIIGRSMYPTIKVGYQLKIAPESPPNLKTGDLIIFKRKEAAICHRLFKKIRKNNKWYFLEKGDNSWLPNVVLEENVIGRVDEVFDRDGALLDSKKWKIMPLYTKLCSFFWYVFFIRFITKKKDLKIFQSLNLHLRGILS